MPIMLNATRAPKNIERRHAGKRTINEMILTGISTYKPMKAKFGYSFQEQYPDYMSILDQGLEDMPVEAVAPAYEPAGNAEEDYLLAIEQEMLVDTYAAAPVQEASVQPTQSDWAADAVDTFDYDAEPTYVARVSKQHVFEPVMFETSEEPVEEVSLLQSFEPDAHDQIEMVEEFETIGSLESFEPGVEAYRCPSGYTLADILEPLEQSDQHIMRTARGTIAFVKHDIGTFLLPIYNKCGMLDRVDFNGSIFCQRNADKTWTMFDTEGNAVPDSSLRAVYFDRQGNLITWSADGTTRTVLDVAGAICNA